MRQILITSLVGLTLMGIGHEASADCNNSTWCTSQTNTGTGVGIQGSSNSVGIYGGTSTGTGVGGSASSTGIGVSGESGSGIGVYGESAVTGGSTQPGVYGENLGSLSGPGVKGASTNGNGVVGLVGTASESFTENGVYGSSSVGNGVLGVVSNNSAAINGYNTNASGWAGYFNTNVDIIGSLYFNGTCYHGPCTSDERLKKNIRPLSGSLDAVAALRAVTYEWKDPTDHRPSGPHAGFIAQEVEKVEPTWVGTDAQGFKNVNMNDLPVLLVDSIRTLKAENDELRGRIAALESARRPLGANFGLMGGLGLLVVGGAFAASRRRNV